MIARVASAALLLLTLGAATERSDEPTLRERRTELADTEAERQATTTAIALITRRIEANEAAAAVLQGRIAALDRTRAGQRAALAARQGEVLHLLAALQNLSRRPSALLLAQPQSAADSARVSLLLDTLVPQLRARTAALRTEIDRNAATRRALGAERARLGSVQAALARDVARLDAAGQALAARSATLRDLVDAMVRRGEPEVPSIALLRPAPGALVGRFGRANAVGVTTQGLAWRTPAGAEVAAPADGRVAFTGPYRTYGRIVIIQHANGILSLLAGLDRASVATGQTVRAGGAIGRMGPGRPTLYLEVRSGGLPVDPQPWLRKSSQG